ncbi:MAG: hypothetical protein H7287_03175 [Thermoleophilia bacterium]|nr:hypothetical protein [Thermoleophilia bacterium]
MSQTTMVALGVSYDAAGAKTVAAVAAQVSTPKCFQRKLEQAMRSCEPRPLPKPGDGTCNPGLDLDQLLQQLRSWLAQLGDAALTHANTHPWGQSATRAHSAATAGLVEAAGHRAGSSDALAVTAAPTAPTGATPTAPPPAPQATTSVTLGRTETAAFLVQQQGVHASVTMRDPTFIVGSTHDRNTDAPIEIGARLETGMRKIADMLRQLGGYMLSGQVPTRDELDAAAAESSAIFQEATRLRTSDGDLGDFTPGERDGVLQLGVIPPTTASIAAQAAVQSNDGDAPAATAPPTDAPPIRQPFAETTTTDPLPA